MKTKQKIEVVRDREQGGFKIKTTTISYSPENYAYRMGAYKAAGIPYGKSTYKIRTIKKYVPAT